MADLAKCEMKVRYESRKDTIALYGIWEEDLVLDVGCGPGPVSQYREEASATHFQRADVITDLKLELVAVHSERRKIAKAEGRFYPPFILANVEALPFKNKAFQFVWCAHTLEHVFDPKAACTELMRVGERGQIRAPSPVKEFFRPNPEHIWLVTWEANLLIFQRKPQLFFHYVHCNLVHHPRVVDWYNARATFDGLPIKAHETIFDWVESFEVKVLN